MNHYIRLFAISTLVIFSNIINAQEKTFSGFYIDMKSDTIKGIFQNYSQWNKNPAKVSFIASGSNLSIHLTPNNTKSFVVEGYDEYLSYSGSRLLNEISDQALLKEKFDVESNDKLEKVTVFVRVITKTKGANLYLLHDSKRQNFFIQVPGDSLVELRFKKSVEGSRLREFADYRQQLNYLFPAEIQKANLSSTLKRLLYNENELSAFLQSIFGGSLSENKKNSGKAKWVISAGIALSDVTINTDPSVYGGVRNFKASFSPVVSIGYLSPINRTFGRFFLHPQLKFFRYSITGRNKQGGLTDQATYQVDMALILQLSAGVNFVNEENLKVFLTVDPVGLFQFGGKQLRQFYYDSNTPAGAPSQDKLRGITYSLSTSAGVSLKKTTFSFTYLLPTNIANFGYSTPQLNGMQLTAGYKLK
jgi:hypothetical protein